MTPEQRIEKLQAEMKTIEARHKRRREADRKDNDRYMRIQDEIEREQLKTQIGKPVQVDCRGRFPGQPWLDDAIGTLVKVNRTRALVEYPGRGEWSIPIRDLQPANEEQGFTVWLGGSTR